MRSHTRAAVSHTAVALVALTVAVHADVAARDAAWAVTSGDVRVACPLTVGGSFDARTSSIRGEWQPAASGDAPGTGTFSVDLTTLDTGISLRNEHLRETYLETTRGDGYSAAVLSAIRTVGLDPVTGVGKGTFTATLTLHGQAQPVSGRVEARRAGDALAVRAEFPVVLPEFGIAKPRYLGVGVKDQVTVFVSFDASRK